jgi:Flp pilus assembly protein TadG
MNNETGSSAVEFGFTLSVFMSMLFGIINLALLLWTLASLHYAAQTAARCAAIGSTGCTSASTVRTYALSQYFGVPLAGTNPFVYSATGCGHTVTASYNYSLAIPLIGTYSLPLSVTACSP